LTRIRNGYYAREQEGQNPPLKLDRDLVEISARIYLQQKEIEQQYAIIRHMYSHVTFS